MPCMILAWWNFLVTPRSFSSSFLTTWSSILASTIFVAKLSEYWARPRSGSHSELTQVWPSWAMQGYRTRLGCRCSSIASLSFFRWRGWVTPSPASNSASFSSSKTCGRARSSSVLGSIKFSDHKDIKPSNADGLTQNLTLCWLNFLRQSYILDLVND